MRSFIASALIIAGVLIGQQWVVKSSEAGDLTIAAQAVSIQAGYAGWMAGER